MFAQFLEERRIGYLCLSSSRAVVELNERAHELAHRYSRAARVAAGRRGWLARFAERVLRKTEGGRRWHLVRHDHGASVEISTLWLAKETHPAGQDLIVVMLEETEMAPSPVHVPYEGLTHRQREVAHLLVTTGLSYKQMAAYLDITEGTCESTWRRSIGISECIRAPSSSSACPGARDRRCAAWDELRISYPGRFAIISWPRSRIEEAAGSHRQMSQFALQRQWRLLETLHGKRRGLSVRTLLDELGVSRSTFYRDLRVLEEAGFPIEKEEQNGEARYRLLGEAMPPVQPTAHQVYALRLARHLLAPLEGTKILGALDALLSRKVPGAGRAPAVVVAPPQPAGEPSITAAIERAMIHGVRIAFTYAASRGEPSGRKVEPLALHVRDGHLYLSAFDVDKRELRTFKIARMSTAHVLEEKAEEHPEYDEARVFAHAAKIWDGPLVDVEVRISSRGARFVNEWPLVPSQQLEKLPDGAVLVRARVSGTVEAMRWVLRWGKDAQVIAPPELRAAVVTELLGAITAYTGEVVSPK
jgi:predicted DNA-binding transcriptional regulator YafY/DNA-directed RNA polymerase specialized sigma24 family protein